MSILVGIDEAGYGPLLGPLVVSGTAFSIPQNLLKADLWDVLHKAVTKDKKKQAGRLLINDSKKAYSGDKGLDHLLRTVLATMDTLSRQDNPLQSFRQPRTAMDLFSQLCPACVESLKDYPWYQNIEATVPAWPKDCGIAANALSRTLAENQMGLLWMQSRFLEVGQYNDRIDKIKNKSRVLFTEICSLIAHVLDNYSDGGEPVQFLIDRQGGREHYHQELLRMFPGMELMILTETETLSSYEMTGGGKRMRLHFTVEADSKYLPVSLASMLSKLVRELLIEELNRYFTALMPTLKPTAGYWQDGLRFLEDIKPLHAQHPIDHRLLVRQK
jgi:ribonuclease HII